MSKFIFVNRFVSSTDLQVYFTISDEKSKRFEEKFLKNLFCYIFSQVLFGSIKILAVRLCLLQNKKVYI